MNTVDTILQKLYEDPAEIEKMAQEEFQKRAELDAIKTLEKVAEEAQLDISQMSDEEKLQLYVALSQQLSELEGGQGGEGQMVAQGQPQPQLLPGQGVPQAQPQPTAQPQVPAEIPGQPTEDFQMKVAENLYFSDLFGKNAAHTYWRTLQELQKTAMEGEAVEETEGSAFEALALQRAEELQKQAEQEAKQTAFAALVEKRAQELLAGRV